MNAFQGCSNEHPFEHPEWYNRYDCIIFCPNEMIWTSNKRNPKIIGATLRNVNEYWKTE